ncbi:unnamed protein product [Cercopithifilaria johnstoni]|uniref:Uncharacterized protein n=1 Tax=Cercopithifilaria johnstoni TaxID=2874296 RepID=A0A8J2M846_9BILA|nr:unnamed protein product [Cercopithifilaria johnstoni]
MTKELQCLLDQYPVFEYNERQKLRCTLTGHEIPSRFDQLDHYVKTSKFVRAWRMHQIMKEYGEYFDDIGPHEFGCKFTRKVIAKDPDDLLRHINGKRFKKGLEKEGDENGNYSSYVAETNRVARRMTGSSTDMKI